MKFASTSCFLSVATLVPERPSSFVASAWRGIALARILLVVMTMVVTCASAFAGDETWINPAISAAISSGATSYTLPAGTYNLDGPILIPAGTRNFTLQGVGSKLTLLTATNTILPYAIQLGRIPIDYNDWGFGPQNCANVAVSPVVTGNTWIYLKAKMAITPGQYYVLYDNNFITQSQAPFDAQNNRRELVKAVQYNSANNSVLIDVPAAREYNVSPTLASTDAFTCTSITIQGIGFDGTYSASTSQFSNGVLQTGITDGLTLKDLATNNFGTRAVDVKLCRNVMATNLFTQNGYAPANSGSAYGPTFQTSRFVTVSNSTSNLCRHGVVTTNGSTDLTFNNVTVTGPIASLDSHGFDDRRITYENCTTTGTINCGNDNWLGGVQTVSIVNCNQATVWVGPNANGVTVTGGTLAGIYFDSANRGTGFPTSGFATNILCSGVTFSAPRNMLTATSNAIAGRVTFTNCVWDQTDPSWGQAIILTVSGNFTFTDNTFNLSTPRPTDVAVQLMTPIPGLSYVMSYCVINAPKAQNGVQLLSSLAPATVKLENTSFKTQVKGATLVLNGSSVVPGQWGTTY